MALKKVTTHKGIELEYWSIISYWWSKETNLFHCRICPYLNAATELEDPRNYFNEIGRDYIMEGPASLSEAYDFILTNDDGFFATASDLSLEEIHTYSEIKAEKAAIAAELLRNQELQIPG